MIWTDRGEVRYDSAMHDFVEADGALASPERIAQVWRLAAQHIERDLQECAALRQERGLEALALRPFLALEAFTLRRDPALDAYQEEVKRTCATSEPREMILLGLVGLQDELGEIAGPVKKHLWHGHDLDPAHLHDEIGDVLWYLATLCNALDLSLDTAIQANLDKLAARYPDGFSSERSLHRSS